MSRKTEEESFLNKCKKIIKEIWEGCGRSKDEFIFIGYKESFRGDKNWIIVKTTDNGIEIHKSSFENYFNDGNKERQQSAYNEIVDYLKRLIDGGEKLNCPQQNLS
jgi:hypothetical protein